MKNIFSNYKEKFLKGVKLKVSDGILVDYDDNRKAIKKDELCNLFTKGLVVVELGDGSLVRPTSYAETDSYSYVSYTTAGDQGAAVENVFYSDGYSAG